MTRPMAGILHPIQHWLEDNGSEIAGLCITAILLFFTIFLLASPVRLTDTDLWYHLAGGRYLFESGSLANPYNDSFVVPARDSLNYFWGFQALVYGIWTVTGYLGLIVVKAIIVATTAWFMTKTLVADTRFSNTGWITVVIVALAILLLGRRSMHVRPHIFSYLFIALFIYILMYRKSWLPALPLITVIWVNLHGVEWVVGALIGGSYGLHLLVQYQQDRKVGKLKPLIWVIACTPFMMVNPHGLGILTVPFGTPPDLDYFIQELLPLNFPGTLLLDEYFLQKYSFILLLLFSLGVFVRILSLGKMREHLFAVLLFTGGLILLSMGNRFVWEWLMLSTPLFSVGLKTLREKNQNLEWKRVMVMLLCTLLLAHNWWQEFRHRNSQYPFDEDSLPRGTTDFIYNLGLKGKYAVPPSLAGYIEWRLAPQNIEIHSDMQFPPFTSEEHFEIVQSMFSPSGHQHLVEKYAPDFISVSKGNSNFSNLVSDQFVPVFFDHKLVLFMNRDSYPEIAKQHELSNINPFDVNRIQKQNLKAGIEELKVMLEVTENIPRVKVILAGLLIEADELDEAKTHLDSVREFKPDFERIAYFTARIAHRKEDYPRAIHHYIQALSVSSEPYSIRRLLGECYFQTGDMKKAFNSFEASINPYKHIDVSLLDYYLFAFASFAVGNNERSQRLIEQFQILDDDADPALTGLVEDLKLLHLE